ncbi:MAG TPA: hypothetical protein VEG44_04890 [Candidatus Acidoferrales bacterium]|nr:hypothetical protein [Candidatus Acidoferrales bacterium]
MGIVLTAGVIEALILFALGKPVLLLGPAGDVVLTAATAPTLIPLLLSGVLTFVGIATVSIKL